MSTLARQAQLGICMLVLAAGTAQAIDVKDFKRVTDRMGNKLVETYDGKAKAFGSAEQQKDLELQAMIVAALCGSPREYREANGPFISEPVKTILAQWKDDAPPSTAAWVAKALKSTENEKYKATVEKLHASLKKPQAASSAEGEAQKLAKLGSLSPAEQAAVLTNVGHLMKDGAKTEVTADGQKTTLGQLTLDVLDKLENKTGKISEDLRVNALALNLANVAYKVMK